jgi:hypothetical protein
MSLPLAIGRTFTNGSGETRTITDIGAKCSPGGKFPDWCTWAGSAPSDKGACSFSTFTAWCGETWQVDGGIEAPRGPLATLESLNEMRGLQGQRLVTSEQYAARIAQGTIPEQTVVDAEIAEHAKAKLAPKVNVVVAEEGDEDTDEVFDADAVVALNAKPVIAGLEDGDYDDHLDALEAAENKRKKPRKTVLAAIEARR